MTDYAKFETSFAYSTQSDYGRPMATKSYSLELTPSEFVTRRFTAAITGGTDVWTVAAPSQFTSITGLLIKNLDSTNFVTVKWDNAAGDTIPLVLLAGGWNFITDIDPTALFNVTADTATVAIELYITGA